MPRFTLHLPAAPPTPEQSPLEDSSRLKSENAPSVPSQKIPEGLRTDSRLKLLGELPRMLLIECSQQLAEEWLAKMPGWVLKQEQKAKIPDPRPKLRKRMK